MSKQAGDKTYYINIFGGLVAGVILLYIFSSYSQDMTQFSKRIGFDGMCSLLLVAGVSVSVLLVILKRKKELAYFYYYWLILYGFASMSEDNSWPYDVIVFMLILSIVAAGRYYKNHKIKNV